jgi:mono/diheme cytochrome c family protein
VALFAACAAPAPPAPPPPDVPQVVAASTIDAGRYLVLVGNCNDCHTAGWMEKGRAVPESEWLAGLPVGWRGSWGTTYGSNLRLIAHELPEEVFVQILHTRTEAPPMPWTSVNALSDRDARAIYAFIRSLGPKGEPMPTAVAPGKEPATPYFLMEPQPPR